MKKTENEKYLASRKLIEYVRKNEARAQKVPAFCRIISNLEAQTKLVSAAESQSTQDTTGATKEKNNLKLINVSEKLWLEVCTISIFPETVFLYLGTFVHYCIS